MTLLLVVAFQLQSTLHEIETKRIQPGQFIRRDSLTIESSLYIFLTVLASHPSVETRASISSRRGGRYSG